MVTWLAPLVGSTDSFRVKVYVNELLVLELLRQTIEPLEHNSFLVGMINAFRILLPKICRLSHRNLVIDMFVLTCKFICDCHTTLFLCDKKCRFCRKIPDCVIRRSYLLNE